MNELVSVVVPIYNVEQYLDRCINSIVNQTYNNLEILLIDDGSPDRCPEMCDEWAKKDNRIKVIHKENQGLGMARNTGIENATGDYICFFDSDDYVSEELINSCVEMMHKYHPDIVAYGFYRVEDKNTVKLIVPNTPKEFYSNEEIADFVLPNFIGKDLNTGTDHKFVPSACSCLFDLNLIKNSNIRFYSERQIISEDVYFMFHLFAFVKSFCVIPKPYYYYYKNSNSLTNVYREDRFLKIKDFYNDIVSLSDELGYSESIKYQLIQPFINYTIGAIKQIVRTCDKKSSSKLLKEILKDRLFESAVKQYNTKHETLTKKILFLAFRHKDVLLLKLLVRLKGDK